MKRNHLLAFSLAASLVGSTPHIAEACGGCFHPPPGPHNTVTAVTNHRMVMAVHANDSILWDQIKYSGNPADFSWVLPVFGDVDIATASVDFFDQLDADTAVTVQSPPLAQCPSTGGGGVGCGGFAGSATLDSIDSGAARNMGPPVTVTHEAVVGPYMTVTLRSTDANALTDWLNTNGYMVPASITPIIQYYTDRHMDFVALRLRPDQGQQSMTPIRITYHTANMVLPLRMISAGVSDKVGITLWVFGNGRYEAANFGNGVVDANELVWDWNTNTSNYTSVFASTLHQLGDRAWITQFAGSSALLQQPQSAEGRAEWALASGTPLDGGTGAGSSTMFVSRLSTQLALQFLDNDLQLEAATSATNVSNFLQTTRASGTAPAPRCSSLVEIPRDDDVVRRPARTLLAAALSALAVVAARRRKRA